MPESARQSRRRLWARPHRSDPSPEYEQIRDYVAFYAGLVDEAYVGRERVVPQPGRFHGGWITSSVVGPFKGARGTGDW